jgi:hypothetical protein
MSRTDSYRSVYDVLDALRVRPGMFFGNKSIALLQAFISGLSFSELDSGTPSFWDFQRWLEICARASSSFPWQRLEEDIGVEPAFDKYFEYLDEFRANTYSELAEAFPPFRANFVTIVNGERVEPDVPERISLVKLIPSDVIFLREHYGGREAHAHGWRAFPTVHDAEVGAEQRWGIGRDRWNGVGRAG